MKSLSEWMEWSTPPQWAPSKSYASWLPPSCWWIIHIHSVLATFHLHQSPWESSSIIEIIIQPKCDSENPLHHWKINMLNPKCHEGLVQIYNKFPFFQDLRWISFQLSSRFIFQGKKIGSSRNLQGLMTTGAKTKTSFLLLDAQLPTNISLLWTRGPLDLQTAPHFVPWFQTATGDHWVEIFQQCHVGLLKCAWTPPSFTRVCIKHWTFHTLHWKAYRLQSW